MTDDYLRLSLFGDQLQVVEALAAAQLNDADRRLARVLRMTEVLDKRGETLATIESDVTQLVNAMSEQRNLIAELCANLAGVIAAMRELKDQRDEALHALHQAPTAEGLYEELVARIVHANGCSREDAMRIAYVLTAPDEELLTYDVVQGYQTLARFRAAVFAALTGLDAEVQS